jgi:hypothetical protein
MWRNPFDFLYEVDQEITFLFQFEACRPGFRVCQFSPGTEICDLHYTRRPGYSQAIVSMSRGCLRTEIIKIYQGSATV